MKKILITLMTVVAVAGLGVGIAWATGWTTAGSGTGSADSGNACLNVTVGTATGLYPGATVSVPVDFGNCSDVLIGLDVDTVTPSFDAGAQGACALSAVYVRDVDGDDHSGVSHVEPGATDTGDTIDVSMGAAAGNGCQGQSFNVHVAATASQCPAP